VGELKHLYAPLHKRYGHVYERIEPGSRLSPGPTPRRLQHFINSNNLKLIPITKTNAWCVGGLTFVKALRWREVRVRIRWTIKNFEQPNNRPLANKRGTRGAHGLGHVPSYHSPHK
jgi:hypothetical protein